MALKTKKISELAAASSLAGLETVGNVSTNGVQTTSRVDLGLLTDAIEAISESVRFEDRIRLTFTNPQSPQSQGWYMVHLAKWDDKYADPENYRLCMMREKRGSRGQWSCAQVSRVHRAGTRWTVPMLGVGWWYADAKAILPGGTRLTTTDILGSTDVDALFNNSFWTRLTKVTKPNPKSSRSIRCSYSGRKKQRVGVAVFKKIGSGLFDWERLSNIVGFEYTYAAKADTPTAIYRSLGFFDVE